MTLYTRPLSHRCFLNYSNRLIKIVILEEIARNPHSNSVAVRDSLQLNVSATTVRRRLHAAGIHHRIAATKEKLLERHRMERLRFAQQYVQEGLDFWGSVIFSDEKTFFSTSHGQLHCWRHNNTRYVG